MSGQTLGKALVPLAGGAVAVYTSSGLAYYRHGDWLRSSRLASTWSRGVYYDGAYAPYGENYAETGTTDRSFTGQNQDMVSTGSYPLYDFLMREYNPTWGRWISPDPAGLAATNPANPQTWNRYAYVTNNPLALIDPLGLDNSGWKPCYEYYCAPTCDEEGYPSCISAYGMGVPLPQYEANYAGDAPFSSAANSPLATTMAAANAFVTNVTGFVMNAVAIPGVGQPGYQGGGEFDIGFKWFVNQTLNDLLESYLASFAAGTLAYPSSFPSNLPGLMSWLDAEEDLQDWLKYASSPIIPTLSPPSTACFASYAAYMTKLGKSALAYYQTQKQAPPLSMTIPPPIQCN